MKQHSCHHARRDWWYDMTAEKRVGCLDCGAVLTAAPGHQDECPRCHVDVTLGDHVAGCLLDDGERLACEECGESFNVRESGSETHCGRCRLGARGKAMEG